MSKKVTSLVMVQNEKSFDFAAKGCDPSNKKPSSYPCLVARFHHDGEGHCDDWNSYKIFHPDANHTTTEQKEAFLMGVMAGIQGV